MSYLLLSRFTALRTTIGGLLVAFISLTSSCQSSKPAFQFQQPAYVAQLPDSSIQAQVSIKSDVDITAGAVATTALAVTPVPAVALPAAVKTPLVHNNRPNSRQTIRSSPKRTAHLIEAGEPENKGWHLVLGAVLVIGAVVTGLVLGGWLGLGVGAAGVLLGYYFLVLGIGGPHAWLGIFQECFNM
ncbi:hypothetical protein [Hymenobacter sp. BT730]|uniref:hypothetical protein n=1 Tax=Hymenobacter sp. BT730 TaxID=3063332 RepID=UPI0026E0981E|nr:hypothetical protein [Hymenobacter sp. BT730]